MRDRGETIRNGAIQLLLAVNAVIMIYPLFVMVASSFKTNAEIFSSPLSLPTHFSTANLEKVWTETNFVRYLANSVGITAASVALILLFSTLAGYAFARYRFRLSSLVLMFFLSGMTVPLKLAIIPLFIQLDTLGLVDSYPGLVLVYVAMGIPSAVVIMTDVASTTDPKHIPWNKGKIMGAKPPLRPKHVWSIRTKLQVEGRIRDLARQPIDFRVPEIDVDGIGAFVRDAAHFEAEHVGTQVAHFHDLGRDQTRVRQEAGDGALPAQFVRYAH